MDDTLNAESGPVSETPSLVAELRRERSAIADQGKEISVLVQQTAAEIERATQRNREIASLLRQLDDNIEGFSRAEVRQICQGAQEAQMRLFMMESQMEQLKGRKESLDRTAAQLGHYLSMAEGGAVNPTPPADWQMEQQASSFDQAPSPAAVEVALQSVELVRHQLSRQLQDRTAQVLSDLMLRAEVCERMVEMDPHQAKEEISKMRQTTAAALKSTRRMVQGLHSPVLEEQGVVAAIRRYIEEQFSDGTLKVTMSSEAQEGRLSPTAELVLFRVVQEALDNVSRHSGVSEASLALTIDGEGVTATVADAGCGFDAEAVLAEVRSRDHSGLKDMEMRTGLVGGTLRVDTQPDGGCVVTLTIPLE